MDLVRTDPDFRPKAKAHPVGHAGTRVPEDAGAADGRLELLSNGSRRGEYGVGMVGRMSIDVCNGE